MRRLKQTFLNPRNIQTVFGLRLLMVIYCVCAATACGGGGGGGGGGRTTETAVRLVHSGIDVAPLEVQVAGATIQKGGFGDVTDFVPVAGGPIAISLQRANSPGVIFQTINDTLAEETEYTIFVAGSLLRSASVVSFLAEPVARPEPGFARVQLLNGLEGAANLTLQGGGVPNAAAVFGGSTGFLNVPFGPQVFTVSERDGPQVASFSVDLADQSESTLVVEGSQILGVTFQRVFTDLD